MTDTVSVFDPVSFVRPAVLATPAYVPARMPENRSGRAIKLDMNESPYGPSPKTIVALRDFAATHRYPDFEQAELREALAAYTRKPADQIICGAGLDDVFTTFMHTIIDPGDQVIISEPTFGVYRSLVALSQGETVNVPLTPDFQLDVDQILAAVTPAHQNHCHLQSEQPHRQCAVRPGHRNDRPAGTVSGGDRRSL